MYRYVHTKGQSDWYYLNFDLSWLIFTCHIIEYIEKYDISFAWHWPMTDGVSHRQYHIYIYMSAWSIWRNITIRGCLYLCYCIKMCKLRQMQQKQPNFCVNNILCTNVVLVCDVGLVYKVKLLQRKNINKQNPSSENGMATCMCNKV